MSIQLPPLDPRIVQPAVNDGVYLAGWQHGLNYDDKTGVGVDPSRFIPTFHVASVGEPPINVPTESLKSPVLAKDVINGINPTAQYVSAPSMRCNTSLTFSLQWHIKRKVDSGGGSVIIKPLLSLDIPDNISAVNSVSSCSRESILCADLCNSYSLQDNKMFIQDIFVPPEWIMKPISTEAPLYV